MYAYSFKSWPVLSAFALPLDNIKRAAGDKKSGHFLLSRDK